MLAYQGSKSAYSGDIARIINETERGLPFIDGCCGSGVMTEQMSRPTVMIDAGAWGKFWHTLHSVYTENPGQLGLIRARAVQVKNFYIPWVKDLAQQPIPKDNSEFILAFLALQREAFRGKPIGLGPLLWKHPGFRDAFSYEMFMQGLQRSFRTIRLVDKVLHGDISNYVAPQGPHNFYIDPDYEGTTGYYHTAELPTVMSNNPHCNFFVSHHTELPGRWDRIEEITGDENRVHVKSIRELVHIKRRSL